LNRGTRLRLGTSGDERFGNAREFGDALGGPRGKMEGQRCGQGGSSVVSKNKEHNKK